MDLPSFILFQTDPTTWPTPDGTQVFMGVNQDGNYVTKKSDGKITVIDVDQFEQYVIDAELAVTQAQAAATSAGNSSTAASGFATAASASADSAEQFAIATESDKDEAETAAATATAQAAIATTKAGEADDSAIAAAGSETAALNSANAAAISANNSANSATAAGNSATTAGNAAANASTSATTATTQAGIATTQSGIATGAAASAASSESSATSSASSASMSASTASSAATTATAQAVIATNQATSATTQATNASASATTASAAATTATTQAGNASASATAAAASAAQAAATLASKADITMANVAANLRRRTVSNIAALKALVIGTDVLNNEWVDALGYYSIGDGGGGSFYAASASSETDNGGNIIAPTSGSGRFKFNVEALADVRRFGAKGDGVSVDSAFLQNAMNSGAKIVSFPPGRFLQQNVIFPSSTRIIGVPGATTLVLESGATLKFLFNSSSSKIDFTIDGFIFDLNGVTGSVGLNLVNCTDGIIERNAFGGNYGVYLLGGTNGIRISNNKFANGNYAIVTENSSSTSNITVVNNVFKNLVGDGVAVNCPTGSSRGWTITGNTFDTIGNNTSAGYGVSLSGNYIDDVSVASNSFYRCDHQAVHIEDGSRNVSVVSNTMSDCGFGSVQTYRSGVYIAASVAGREISNITISGNQIHGVSSMDFGVYCGPAVDQNAVQIINNTITKFLTYGIRCGSLLKNSMVSSNIIYNGAGPGILAAGSDNSFSENRCFDNQIVKTQTYGIEISGGTDCAFTDNDLKGNSIGGILVTSLGTRARIKGTIDASSLNMTTKPQNVAAQDITPTEMAMGVPIKDTVITPFSITGTLNDRPIGLSQVFEVQAATSTPQLTGVVARDYTHILIKNNSANTFTLMHQNAGSVATNRLILKTGTDSPLTSGQMKQFYYFSNRWNEL